ncbi:MAG: DcaP family trimeric outer membrane transporter [Dyella sp.]
MTIAVKPRRYRVMAWSMACALGLPLAAQAQEAAREQQLEQRVAQLEQQLADLKSMIQAQKSAPAPATAAAPVAGAPAAPIQATVLVPTNAYKRTTVKVGGFIKTDFLTSHTDGYLGDQAPGRDLYLPGATPLGGRSANYSDVHAKFSRLYVGVDSLTENNEKIGAYLEWDFFGNSLGNENSTNTYGLTLRHAYAYWGKWLAGQTWTNFMDPNALPESVDFIGPTDGTVFSRQAQIRYTSGGFSVALENPHTTLTPYRGGATQISPDHNLTPDLTARYTWKGDWGFVGVAGLLRQLREDEPAIGPRSTEVGVGGSVMGKWIFGTHDDLRYAGTYGKGIARYLGLANIAADGALDARGNIEARKIWAGYVAWRHAFTEKLRSNLMYAHNGIDNDLLLTGGGANKSTQSVHINLIYSPLAKLDLGAEYTWARREIENGDYGRLQRLQFMAKYSF